MRSFVLLLFIIWQGLSAGLLSQQSAHLTQYMDNPLLLNPAFAGNRNSLAVDVFSRQQWVGIEGAPATYYVGIHLPFNHSSASAGATILSEQTGPLMYNKLTLDYSYLLRTSRRSFLSLGLRAGVDHFNLNYSLLPVIDFNDPEFSGNIENQIRPSFGAGLVYIRPSLYLSASLPHFSFASVPWASEAASEFETYYNLLFSGGYHIPLTKNLNLKLAGIHYLIPDAISSTDVSLIISHEEGFRGGISHRLKQSFGIILGMQFTDQIGVTYSYELPVSMDPIVKRGMHELSLSFDFTKHIVPNRNRRFLHRKKKEKEQDEEMNSIRYF